MYSNFWTLRENREQFWGQITNYGRGGDMLVGGSPNFRCPRWRGSQNSRCLKWGGGITKFTLDEDQKIHFDKIWWQKNRGYAAFLAILHINLHDWSDLKWDGWWIEILRMWKLVVFFCAFVKHARACLTLFATMNAHWVLLKWFCSIWKHAELVFLGKT